eukprot:CAMPEP_0198132982 /NCGR_PEP_ID=MMETSP1442-20131203/59328_1 /TAXON_ID= /ORGANISM="Craspedostauros australis, Strain CCMP3328" /LENGTH=385 /DNA_ID=CAMNT_0043794085 /DNA_START=649 /DNA_END=1806 /DNA_ORIENTATION=-
MSPTGSVAARASSQLQGLPFGIGDKGNSIDKGFNILEVATTVVPQGRIVGTAKGSLNFVWKRMMTELAPQDKSGLYQRPKVDFGGVIGSAEHPLERNRYQVYLGNPCPWCHRVQLVINVLGLDEDLVGVTNLIDDPIKASRGGWIFRSKEDSKLNVRDMREMYDKLTGGSYKGRCTAPALVDLKSQTIVANESPDILRMLPKLLELRATTSDDEKSHSNAQSSSQLTTLVPPELESYIDETNAWVYQLLSNGVYQCGFSTTQQAYDAASRNVREGLERCEERLSKSPFMCGDTFTESDVMLLPTMLRYDGVYSPLFKAGGTHISIPNQFPNIQAWRQRCWREVPGVSTSTDLADANESYYKQLFPLNPGGIIPTPVTAKDLGLEP